MNELLQRRIQMYDDLLRAARGEIKIDTVIQGGTILNVHTGDLLEGNVGIHKGFIVSVFNDHIQGLNVIKATGKTLIPAFIDPHIHIESSMILPPAYAQIAAINGTGTIFADPHEIVNVMGVDGFSLMVNNSQNLPARLYFDIPTCVPSKRGAETSGADIRVNEIKEMLQKGGKKLGELMSVEEIVSGDPIITDIIKAGWESNIPRDSHFHLLLPKLGEAFGTLSLLQKMGVAMGIIGGKFLRLNSLKTLPGKIFVDKLRSLDSSALDTYLVALGFTADHENYGPELQLKLDRGMRLMISSHVFAIPQMLPLLITSIKNLRYTDSIGLCTDDLWPDELVKKGGMLGLAKGLVRQGLDPIDVVRFATLNNAQRLTQAGIKETILMGAIAPGLVADIVILNGS
ncbi:MAG: amidohydrolase family protein, partial [Candidatus Thorarchaeota archaeon]